MLKKTFLPVLLLLTFTLLTGCGSSTPTNPNLNLLPLKPDEKVTVVEFSDFNCPACAGAFATSREVRRMPGVHFELRHFPLGIPGHETSRAAANAYECGKEQGLADEFEIALFENQGKFTDEFLAQLPTKYGYTLKDPAGYAACLQESRHSDTVATDYRTAVQAGLNSTPSFVVDGEVVAGAARLIEKVQAASAGK